MTLWKMYVRCPRADEDFAPICAELGFVAIGWDAIGDLANFSTKDEIVEALSKEYPDDSSSKLTNNAACLWSFVNDLDIGHSVVCPERENQQYYVGSVESGYYRESPLADQCPFTNRRQVNWLSTVDKDQIVQSYGSANFGGNQTLSRISKGSKIFSSVIQPPKRRVRRGKVGRPQRPDPEWGRLAEFRAMAWLRGKGLNPRDVSHLSRGWDIECNGLKYEVKGCKSSHTRLILTQNEMSKARQYGKKYVLVIFTGGTASELNRSIPVQYRDPANILNWKTENIYILQR